MRNMRLDWWKWRRLIFPVDAAYTVKSMTQSPTPKVSDRPAAPPPYREFNSPRMKGAGMLESDWAAADCLSRLAAVVLWFMRVPWRVTPGEVAPVM
jgi:hypothetical protein